ncbi:MAG: 2-C-methyl-D-erythritol 4-phosphate cytidylyltransferase [Gammaproteobacteria bacterium]|uniref:2-C-methyl-D-erythritol 4-phosphate cytidylyltransferase n=1 Tax=Candidatus Thiopontia autotrophica TaxID=2841688 RepID=A0A8J6NXQ8_9GAMM|nr:2-C-methyl-D-erythritol 4-phosphate cytidylyltransferase [Candidatus Thiopontia autotrophica]MBL6968904.1 2-C-methyl-D-erythritol 4-phosphate cytidylyltransferase [Gammaproteobacteria bacterium]
MHTDQPVIWGIVPAAGIGLRMMADRPKQYLDLAGSPVIKHSIDALFSLNRIQGVVVSIAAADQWWPEVEFDDHKAEKILVVEGGKERSDSVLNALNLLADKASDDDWVLVHDAARPCLRGDDLEDMVGKLWNHPVGGILASPLADTIKRSGTNREIVETVDRSGLWRALTPQMFRLGMLRSALRQSMEDGVSVTDDSQAIEYLGFQPEIIEGDAGNMKITHPGDILLAEEIMQRERGKS